MQHGTATRSPPPLTAIACGFSGAGKSEFLDGGSTQIVVAGQSNRMRSIGLLSRSDIERFESGRRDPTLDWNVQALAFDFDGLILDTETPELRVWTDVFAEYGVAIPDGYWASMMGRGAEQEIERPSQLLERLASGFRDSPEKHEVRRRRIRALIDQESIRPGVRELMNQAKELGIPFGVASSSRHEWVDKYLIKLGIFGEMEFICCADDVERAKPFPDLYLLLCSQMGADPLKTMALEDSPNGVAAAKTAGLFTIAVPNSVTAQLDLSLADRIVGSLLDVDLCGFSEMV